MHLVSELSSFDLCAKSDASAWGTRSVVWPNVICHDSREDEDVLYVRGKSLCEDRTEVTASRGYCLLLLNKVAGMSTEIPEIMEIEEIKSRSSSITQGCKSSEFCLI